MKRIVFLSCALLAMPVFGQTMYKCPSPTPGAPAVYQQMPCTPTGGGEAMQTKTINSSGGGLRESERAYLNEQSKDKPDNKKSDESRPARSSEVDKECFVMKRRLADMQEREARGIHTWSKHGYEESHYLTKQYENLCGSL